MELSDLRKIAEAATKGPYRIGHIDESRDYADVDGPDGVSVALVYARTDQSYFATFDPSLVLKLLEALSIAGSTLKYIAQTVPDHPDVLTASLERGDQRLFDIREAREALLKMDEILGSTKVSELMGEKG